MLLYSHYTAAVKIAAENTIDFVSRRRQQGLPMTISDNAHFCVFFHIYYATQLYVIPLCIMFYLLFHHLIN